MTRALQAYKDEKRGPTVIAVQSYLGGLVGMVLVPRWVTLEEYGVRVARLVGGGGQTTVIRR